MIVEVVLPEPQASPDRAQGLLDTAVTAGCVLLAVGLIAAVAVYYNARRSKSISTIVQILAIVGIAGGFTLIGTGLGRSGIPEANWKAAEVSAVQDNVVQAVENSWQLDIPDSEHEKLFSTTSEAQVVFNARVGEMKNLVSCKLTNFLSSDKSAQRLVSEGKPGRMQLGVTCDGVGEPKKRK